MITKKYESAPDRTNIGQEYIGIKKISREFCGVKRDSIITARWKNTRALTVQIPSNVITPNKDPQFASDPETKTETQTETETGETYLLVRTYIRLALHG